MARHVVHRRNGHVDEYQELPDTEHLEPDIVTVTFADGATTVDCAGLAESDAGALGTSARGGPRKTKIPTRTGTSSVLPPPNGPQILAIDDEQDLLDIIQSALTAEGHEVNLIEVDLPGLPAHAVRHEAVELSGEINR